MIFIYTLVIYFVTGFVFACWFSFFKVEKTDEGAKGTSFWFKLIIMPAAILLWPVVLIKLLKRKTA